VGDKPKKTRESSLVGRTTIELSLVLILVAKVAAIVHQVS
jgi:hypothetical protein